MTTMASGRRAAHVGGVDVLLANGAIARIRPYAPDDVAEIAALHERSSDDSIRSRFLTLNRRAASTYVEHIATAPPEEVLSLVMEQDSHLVGLATAEVTEPGAAEMSFLVDEHMFGRGVATLLLEHLAAWARRVGIRRLDAVVSADNYAMLDVLDDAGFDTVKSVQYGVMEGTMSTEATERAIEAADVRECRAEARSLAALMHPGTVAVAGVSRRVTGVGRAVLDAIREGGFKGTLVAIHPETPDLQDIPVYPSVSAVPGKVDLLVVAVPAPQVPAVLEEAGDAGVAVAVVITSGFAEEEGDGDRIQSELVATARRHGMRLIGPNCFGVASYSDDVRLDATFARRRPRPGGLAVASQSGGVGIALLDAAVSAGLGLAAFVSLGNKADVSSNDLLGAWIDDDAVTVAALYLESFGNPRKFARFARRFSERKPLIAVVGGRSASGSRAGASHTAAAASPVSAVEALFTQAGVIPVSGLDEMVVTALLLTSGPLPSGRRLGIVGNAGGLGVLAADAAADAGLEVPLLSAELQRRLATTLGAAPGTTNPIDLGAAASAATFEAAASLLLDSGEVDGLLVVFAATRVGDTSGVAEAVRRVRADARVPVLQVVHGDDLPEPRDPSGEAPRFRSVDDAVRAFGHAARYARWRDTPRTVTLRSDQALAPEARERARRLLASAGADGWLSMDQIQELVADHGIEAPTGTVCHGAVEAVAAARTVGFPVAVKVADPEVLHKTERGLVATALTSDDAVADAVRRFADELGRASVPVLVQPHVDGGVELAVGVVRDPGFGPLVMVAAGGIAMEVWRDRVFLAPPVTEQDVSRALGSLRITPLLEGFRGSPAVNISALRELVLSVAELVEDMPEIAEMDLNPVIATPTGVVCVDARVRLTQPGGSAEALAGVPRQLRMQT